LSLRFIATLSRFPREDVFLSYVEEFRRLSRKGVHFDRGSRQWRASRSGKPSDNGREHFHRGQVTITGDRAVRPGKGD
jgi:hypothetical protein